MVVRNCHWLRFHRCGFMGGLTRPISRRPAMRLISRYPVFPESCFFVKLTLSFNNPLNQ
jgi:hypothetical protein